MILANSICLWRLKNCKTAMKKVLFLQFFAGCLLSFLAWFWVGKAGAISAAMVALSVVVPNVFFAFFLKLNALPFVFWLGEITKIFSTVGLLVILVVLYPSVHWPSFLVSLIVVLQVAIFGFMEEKK